jgi:hypothetical protein
VGSYPAEDDGFLKAIKVRGTTSFGGEAKPSARVVRFYDMLKILAEYDRDTSPVKLTYMYCHFHTYFSTRCLC